eukprot:6197232-Pleurochrysis_carterae.AAC.2
MRSKKEVATGAKVGRRGGGGVGFGERVRPPRASKSSSSTRCRTCVCSSPSSPCAHGAHTQRALSPPRGAAAAWCSCRVVHRARTGVSVHRGSRSTARIPHADRDLGARDTVGMDAARPWRSTKGKAGRRAARSAARTRDECARACERESVKGARTRLRLQAELLEVEPPLRLFGAVNLVPQLERIFHLRRNRCGGGENVTQ